MELLGVLEAARLASVGDTLVTDSMNTIYWVRAGRSNARPHLNDVCAEAKQVIREKRLNVEWRPREENDAGNYIEFVLKC